MVVTVVRAEGLPGITSSSLFRRAKSQTHRRYVRVRIVDKSEGRDQCVSAVTSSLAGGGPTCRWGEKGGGGESVYLGVDGRESTTVLELEVWNDQSESGAEDVLLCSGKTDMGDVGPDQSRWVVLNPKGKVEVSVSTSPPAGNKAEQLDGTDREPALERDGQTLPLEINHAQEDANTENLSEEITPENPLEPRSLKWGMPRMPGLKNSLNISLGRAANLRAKQREEPPVNGTNGELVGTASRAEDASQPTDIVDERQSITGDGRERQVTGEKTLPDEHIVPGKQSNRGAMRGIQSIKESLQTRILGVSSGKPPAEGKDTQNEDVQGVELQHEGVHDLPSEIRKRLSSARRSTSPSKVPMEPDELGNSQAQVKQENSQKRLSRDKRESASSIDGGGHADRRRRGYQSPLRSLLQEPAAGDQEIHESDEGEEDSTNESGGDDIVRRSIGDDEDRSGSQKANGAVAQVVSALDAASAIKAAASRLKSTLPSPKLGSNFKGLSREKTGSASSSDGDGHPERHRSGYQSPLRSLLQDEATGDQETHECEGGKGNATNESGGDDAVWRGTVGDEESHAAKGKVAQAVSALDAASAVKAAASRLKSTLSSPKLGSTLKGLGWNKLTKEEVVEGGPPSPSSSSCDHVDRISSTTPTVVDEARQPATQLGGISDPRPLPLDATTTVLVAIFRASGLPEMLTKNIFGRTKKTSTQNPFVRLTLCGFSVSTSAVQGGGRDCRWGKKNEGDIVEITIPSPNVPGAGVATSKMVVEVWNKASDGLEKDILLGSTEILVADWLGKKAKWAALDAKKSQGGRVKLGVSLKDSDGASSIPSNDDGSDNAPVDNGSAPGVKGDEPDPFNPHPAATSSSTAYVGGAVQQPWGAPPQSVPEPNGSGEIGQQDGAELETEKVRSREGSKVSVPLLADSACSDEDQQQPFIEENSTGPLTPSVEPKLEQQQGVSSEATKRRGGEEIDVNSPAQEQNVPSTRRSMETVRSHVDGDQLSAASPDKPSNGPQKSSEVLEGRGPEGGNHGHETEVYGKGEDVPSKLGGESVEKDASIVLLSPAASGSSSTRYVDKKQERTSSCVKKGLTSLDPNESHQIKLLRQQSIEMGLLTPHADGEDLEENADGSATVEDADARTAHAMKNYENVGNSSDAKDIPGASDGLARRVVGGTATSLDLTAAVLTSNQRDDQSTEASTSHSREHTSETPQSSPQGPDAPRQTVPVAHTKSDSNGRPHGQDQEQPRRLRGPRDLHVGGDSGDGSRDGLARLENGRREASSEGMAKAPDSQPREQTKTREVDAERIARAREIVRRHRAAVSSGGHTSPGVQIGSDVTILTTTEQARAATTIQGAFRGRIARRRLRLCQRVVVRVQAAYRGHVDRKDFVALRVRAKRAKAEEKRARARRSRIAFITQVFISEHVGLWISRRSYGEARNLFFWLL